MNENLSNPSNLSGCFKEAVCIDAMRIFDSCSDKDCLEDMPVSFAPSAQQLINSSCYVKSSCVEVENVTFAIEPVPFHCGFFAVDITYAFKVYVDVFQTSSCAPTQVVGSSTFTKKVILYGSDGHTKTFCSDSESKYESNNGCCCSCRSSLPTACVTVVDPIVLDIKQTCCQLPTSQTEVCLSCCPSCEEKPKPCQKFVYVTVGMFSIVQLERRVPLLVPTYEYCLPEKECSSNTDSPCELFDKLSFPVSEFFPKSLDSSCGSCESDKYDRSDKADGAALSEQT